jgi:K+-sensing histidine kinase KdpD
MTAGHRRNQRKVDKNEQKRLLELKRSIQGDLKKLVLDYHRIEHLNWDLKQKAGSLTDETQKTHSQLRSVQRHPRKYQQREVNLLFMLLVGLEEPLDRIERHVDELSAVKHPHRDDDATNMKMDQLRSEVHRLREVVVELMTTSAVRLGRAPLKREKVDVKELVDRAQEEGSQTAQEGQGDH